MIPETGSTVPMVTTSATGTTGTPANTASGTTATSRAAQAALTGAEAAVHESSDHRATTTVPTVAVTTIVAAFEASNDIKFNDEIRNACIKSIGTIQSSSFSDPRKLELRNSALALSLELQIASQQNADQVDVLVMEGAIGVKGGRVSTDGDENLALLLRAKMAILLGRTTVVSVPDNANQKHTIQFLKDNGYAAEEFPIDGKLKPGVVYVSDLSSETETNDIAAKLPNRRVFLLGPPTGHAYRFFEKKDDESVAAVVMGDFGKKENGSFDTKSTNTRIDKGGNPTDYEKFGKALLSLKEVSKYPSGPMDEMTVRFKDCTTLYGSDSPIAKAYIEKWLSNTIEQFTGKAPAHLFSKRFLNSKANEIFKNWKDIDTALKTPKDTKDTSFKTFFDTIGDDSTIDQEAISSVAKSVGFNDGVVDIEQAKKFLKDRSVNLEGASDKKIIAAAVAIVAAMKNIYYSKTFGGWDSMKGLTPFEKCTSANFERVYREDGRQPVYDGIAQINSLIGEKKLTPDEIANRAFLMLMK